MSVGSMVMAPIVVIIIGLCQEVIPVSNFHFQSQLIKSNIMEILKKNNILTLILFIVNRVYILMQLKNNLSM
jgi:hypothetical protein